MQHTSYFKALSFCLMAFGLILTGCETFLTNFSADDITTQAKNAVDVLPADVVAVGMMNNQDLKENAKTDIFGNGGLMGEEAPAELLARLEDFVEATGFNPEKDLDEVYVAIEEKR